MFSLLTFTFLRAASSVVASRRDCLLALTIRYCILFSFSPHNRNAFLIFHCFCLHTPLPRFQRALSISFRTFANSSRLEGNVQMWRKFMWSLFQRYTFFEEFFFHFIFCFSLWFLLFFSRSAMSHTSLFPAESRTWFLWALSCESADPHTWKVF